jgi:hypothetical protein
MGFLAVIERYWIVLVGLILATPVVLRYLKDSQVKNEINDTQEQIKLNASANLTPLTQLAGMNKITTNVAYHNWALQLAKDLGTLYTSRASWWNLWDKLRGATENDKDVYNSLIQINNQSQKRVLNELYFFLVQRNLNEDVMTYLDPEFLKKLPLFN